MLNLKQKNELKELILEVEDAKFVYDRATYELKQARKWKVQSKNLLKDAKEKLARFKKENR